MREGPNQKSIGVRPGHFLLPLLLLSPPSAYPIPTPTSISTPCGSPCPPAGAPGGVLMRALGHVPPCWAAPHLGKEPGPLKPAHFLHGVHNTAHGVPKFPAHHVGVGKWQGRDSNLGSWFCSQILGTELPATPWGGFKGNSQFRELGMMTKDVTALSLGREDPIRLVC